MMDEGEDRIRAPDGDNCGRLGTLNKKYAPMDFHCVNQIMRPS